jgi:hypothetical protein
METGDGANSFQKFVDFYRSDKLNSLKSFNYDPKPFQNCREPKEQQSKMQTIIR